MIILNPIFAFETKEEQLLFVEFLHKTDSIFDNELVEITTGMHHYWCVKMFDCNISPHMYSELYEDYEKYCEGKQSDERCLG